MYLLKEKSKAGETFKQFYAMVKTQFQTDIRVLRTDNGTEYFNYILQNFLSQQGIVTKVLVPKNHNKMGLRNIKTDTF